MTIDLRLPWKATEDAEVLDASPEFLFLLNTETRSMADDISIAREIVHRVNHFDELWTAAQWFLSVWDSAKPEGIYQESRDRLAVALAKAEAPRG